MDSSVLIKNLKIVLIVGLIIGLFGAILYLIYGFTILWQAMAAGIITGFLSLLVLMFIIVSIYLWMKNLLFKRELRKCELELKHCRTELNKIRKIEE